MYKKIETSPRMTRNEALEYYLDNYILIRWDSVNPSDDIGTVLYVGNDRRELLSLLMKLDEPTRRGVSEGLNLYRSLGGVVVGV